MAETCTIIPNDLDKINEHLGLRTLTDGTPVVISVEPDLNRFDALYGSLTPEEIDKRFFGPVAVMNWWKRHKQDVETGKLNELHLDARSRMGTIGHAMLTACGQNESYAAADVAFEVTEKSKTLGTELVVAAFMCAKTLGSKVIRTNTRSDNHDAIYVLKEAARRVGINDADIKTTDLGGNESIHCFRFVNEAEMPCDVCAFGKGGQCPIDLAKRRESARKLAQEQEEQKKAA